MTNKLYQCIGENWVEGFRFGYCDEEHTLKVWIEKLWGERAQEAIEFFDGDSDKDVITYIRQHCGKILIKV